MNVDKCGHAWFYPVNSTHPADKILVTNSKNWEVAGEGFGGGTLQLTLDTGEVFLLRGGWHSNSKSFFCATGIDLTEKTLTRCVLATKLVSGYPDYVLDEILHEENEWHLGKFERPEELAIEWANKLGKPVFCYTQSMGGASMGWKQPVKQDEPAE